MDWKYKRLLQASERFNSYHRFVELLTVVLFLATAVATANKLLPGKLVNSEYLQWSWQLIAIATMAFVALFVGQVFYERHGRILSDFQKEAALKAARKDNYRRPFR